MQQRRVRRRNIEVPMRQPRRLPVLVLAALRLLSMNMGPPRLPLPERDLPAVLDGLP